MSAGSNPGSAGGRPEAAARRNRLLPPALIGILVLLIFLVMGWYVTSPRFQRLLRARVVAELQRSTGGRVELGALHWNLSQLEFEARDLTIHGREAPGEAPFFHADRVLVRLRITSVFAERVALSFLGVTRPVIHLISYPDGSTNQPQPSISPPTLQSDVAQLFRLAVQRLDVQDGRLVLNDRSLPLDLTADDVVANVDYVLKPNHYVGEVRLGKLDTRLNGMRPFASSADFDFTLWPSSARVTALHWRSGASQLTATAHLDNFAHPTVAAAYQGSVDLGELGAVFRNPELRGGKATLEGRATYQAGEYKANGHATASEVALAMPSGMVRHASVSGDYALSNERTLLSNLSGRVLGGSFSGSAEIVQWVEATMRAPHRRPPPPPASEQRGAAHFQLQEISVAQLGQSVSTRAFPVARLHPAGTASGTVQATWRGSLSQADVQLSLAVRPPARPQPGETPLAGQVQAAYSGSRRVLTLSQLNAASPAGNVVASGALGATSANISLNVAGNKVDQLQSILTSFQGPHIPLVVNGKFTFKGTVVGRLNAPGISGRLQITDFDTVLPSPSGAHPPSQASRRLHWDSLDTDIQLSPSSLLLQRAVLRRGQAELDFDGRAGLKRYRVTPASPLSAQLRLQHGELADVVAVAGYDYPLSGVLDGSLRVGGTWQSPQGQGAIQVANPAYAGGRFNVLRADLSFAGRRVELQNAFLGQGPARITGVAGYDFGAGRFHFNLQGSNFDVAKLASVPGNRLSVAGKMDFSIQGSGTRHAPVLNGTLHLRQLVLEGEREGEFTVTASTRDATTHLAGRSQFVSANLNLDGDVRLQGDFPGQLTLRFSRLDVDPLLRAYIRGRLTGHSSTAGTVSVSGPLLRPRELQVRADVSDFQADIENLKLRNSGPLQFAIDREVVSIQHFRVVGDGTDFEASGTAQLASPRVLNLRADGTINLRVLQTLNPDYMSSGLMTLTLRVAGTMANPDIGGRVQISDGSLANIDLPSGLSNINGTLLFNQDRLRVQKLSAQTGGGLLNVGGFISYNRNLALDLTADGRDIRLRYPPGMSTSANVNLHWVGGLDRSTLSGNILVTRFQLARNFDFASYLARAKAPATLPDPHSPLNNLRLDVHVTTTPELDVQTAIARVAGDADLRLRGTAAKPVVLGRVDIARGDVNFSGTRYHLERGDITFSNPVRIEPILDLEASARVRDYDITLGFHGQLDKLNATYSSDPPLPTADIIALLAMGRTRAESAILQQQSETSYTRTASNAILSEALNAANNNRLEKIFGVSRVKIDPEAGGAENNPSWTRVTIEQQISNTLTLTYITNVSQAQEQIIQAEYYLTHNISLIALRDQNGVISFDINIRRRKK